MIGEEFIPANLPAACLTQPCIVGIDEAGRGPVLGPLVYAIFVSPPNFDLRSLGANDSKLQTEQQREAFYQAIMQRDDQLGWRTAVISPRTIAQAMESESGEENLNTISYDTVYGLIAGLLEAGVKIEHAYVDTLGKAETYQARLKARFPTIPAFTVRSKADSLFPVVGAASIVAKVTRDTTLRRWMQSYPDRECGSGYPSDPNTVAWLKRNHHLLLGFPAIVRSTWGTAKRMALELEAKAGVVRIERATEKDSLPSESGFLFSSFY